MCVQCTVYMYVQYVAIMFMGNHVQYMLTLLNICILIDWGDILIILIKTCIIFS